MSILIKGMEMPSFGNETIIRIQSGGGILDQYGHHLDCEAVPVPPHGDLIDHDVLRKVMFIGEQCLYSWDEIEDAIDSAPTIIPAEEET